jgi:hypothetical protein
MEWERRLLLTHSWQTTLIWTKGHDVILIGTLEGLIGIILIKHLAQCLAYGNY